MQPVVAPKTLEAARLARGLSLSALAERCGISAPTLSRLESGKRDASADERRVLAGALAVPEIALSRPLVSERLGLSGFYHRKLRRAGAKGVRAIESQCLLDVVALRELTGMADLPGPSSVLTIDLDDAKGDPEVAANMVRLAWQLPRGPIRDLCRVVEAAGCVVIHTDFSIPEMDALYQKVNGLPPIFWVNSRKPLERVRFSIAHELGHLILHEEKPADEAQAEREADAFAAAFLMPKADFRSECPSALRVPELVEMKRRWRCSMQAIARRARDVGRITDPQYRSIQIELSRRGWRKCEPYPITGESPRVLADVIGTCLRDLDLVEADLADRLGVLPEQISAWRQPFPGQRPDPTSDSPMLRLAV